MNDFDLATTGSSDLATDSSGGDLENEFGSQFLAQDPFASGGRRKKLGGGVAVIAIVVAAAGLGLFSMKHLSKARADDPEDKDAETALKQLPKMINPGNDSSSRVLVALGVDRTEDHVPIEHLKSNPFQLDEPAPDVIEPVEPDIVVNDPVFDEAAERQRIRELANSFTLSTILGGDDPLAIIDGEIVNVGSEISTRDQVDFTVVEIAETEVVLRHLSPRIGPVKAPIKVRR